MNLKTRKRLILCGAIAAAALPVFAARLPRQEPQENATRQPPVDEALLPSLLAYEREAAGYGLALLHETGIRQADQWLSDYSACDLAYLAHFYRTGEKRDPLTFWRANVPLVEPRAIPAFAPTKLVFRSNGVVI